MGQTLNLPMVEAIAFYLFSGVMLTAALLVVFSRQPIYSVLSLLVAMFCLAALFVMLGAYFVAALQILLYAGAVLVLFLFVIMLLNLDKDALARLRPFTRRGVGTVIAILFVLQLIGLITRSAIGPSGAASPSHAAETPPRSLEYQPAVQSSERPFEHPNVRSTPHQLGAGQAGTVAQIGRLLFTKYLLPFELTSFLILAAIIGAVTLARSHDTTE